MSETDRKRRATIGSIFDLGRVDVFATT